MKYTCLLSIFISTIFSSTHAQNIWEPTGGPGHTTLHAVEINDIDYLYALSPFWLVRSEDGHSWGNPFFSSAQNEFWCLAVSGQYIFVGDWAEGLFRSEDYGDTFGSVAGIQPPVHSLAANPANGYIFVSAGNGFFRSTDNGITWTEIPNPGGSYQLIKIKSNGDIFAYSNNGFFRSTDSGNNWIDISGGLQADTNQIVIVYDIAFGPRGKVYVRAWNTLDHNGVFLSVNNGNSWRFSGLPASSMNDMWENSIAVNSFGHIYVGVEGGVYRSTNHGNRWRQMNQGLDISPRAVVRHLEFDSNERLFAGLWGGSVPGVWRTLYSTTSQTFIDSVTNLNRPISHISPAKSVIHINPPSGTISKQNIIPTVESVEITIDEVIHTRTGDLTFTLERNGVVDTIIYKAGGDGQNFISTLLSDDADVPIENSQAPFTGFFKPAKPISVFQGMDPYGEWILTITDDYEGNDGILNAWSLQITLTSPVVSVAEDITEIPDNILLHQNYPNPFNPSTTIQYSVNERAFVTIKVYDILGREIATLVHEEKPPGVYNSVFDAAVLPSGIYYYSLRAGSYYEVKRMVYVK